MLKWIKNIGGRLFMQNTGFNKKQELEPKTAQT